MNTDIRYVSLRYTPNDSLAATPLDTNEVCRRAIESFGPEAVLVSCLRVHREVRISLAVHTEGGKSGVDLRFPGWRSSIQFHSVELHLMKFHRRSISGVAIDLATCNQVVSFSCSRYGSKGVKAFVTLVEDIECSSLKPNRSSRLGASLRTPTTSLVISSDPCTLSPILSLSCPRGDFEAYCAAFSHCHAMVLQHVSDQHISFMVA